MEARTERFKEVISRYSGLATLGQLIDQVLHEGRAPLAKIRNEATLGLRDVDRSGPGGTELIKKLGDHFKTVATQSDALGAVFRKIEPFGGRKRGRPIPVSLEVVIADACSVLDAEIAEVGATLMLPEGDTKVTVDQAEIQRVIINLLQNRLHWMQQVPVGTRQIVVQVCRNSPSEVEVCSQITDQGFPASSGSEYSTPTSPQNPMGLAWGW